MDEHQKPKKQNNRNSHNSPSGKLKGNPRDGLNTRMSKTLSYVLRHGAEQEGIMIRPDGFVLVKDLVGESLPFIPIYSPFTLYRYTSQLAKPKFRELDFETLQSIVKEDNKQRYHLVQDVDQDGTPSDWIIRANQGHTLKVFSPSRQTYSWTDFFRQWK